METTELKFHEITLEDRKWMKERFAEDSRNACEYTFANNYIWRKTYDVHVAELYGCAVIRFRSGEDYIYSYPAGAGDKKAAVLELRRICRRENSKLLLSPLCESDQKQLAGWFPGEFLIFGNRDNYDYIYSREKLSTLAGKKLHGKRNHIARFKDGDDWSYEPMNEENLEECRQMTYSWIRMRSEKWNEEMEEEVMVLHEGFDHMKELGLVGGVLRKGGEMVAFSMGEPLNPETFVVHFEKAYPDMQGAYPMINQQFVLHECQDYTYINREEDTGDPGLRKAKLSYYPEILLKKYVAEESPVVYADRERDGEQIKKIWRTCFGDEEEYITYFLDHRMTEDNMLVIYRDGKAVSMASFLPAEYLSGGAYVSARYVYAVATLPEYRGQGLASGILKFARARFEEPLILAPAEESLNAYYEKLGFQRAFGSEKHELVSAAGEDAGEQKNVQALELRGQEENVMEAVEPVTPEEYVKIRDAGFEKEGYVRWDVDAVRYAMELSAFCGGGTIAVVAEDDSAKEEGTSEIQKDILMYDVHGDTLIVRETTLDEKRLTGLLRELLKETGTSKAVYGYMSGMIWLPDSMQDVKIKDDGYLNLTLA